MIIKIDDGNDKIIELSKDDKFLFVKLIYGDNKIVENVDIKGNLNVIENMTFASGFLINIYENVNKDMNLMNEIWLAFQMYKDTKK